MCICVYIYIYVWCKLAYAILFRELAVRSDRASATRRCAPPRLHMSYSRIHVSILRMESPRRTLGRRMAVSIYTLLCSFCIMSCLVTSVTHRHTSLRLAHAHPRTTAHIHKRTIAHPLAHHCAKNQRLRAEPAHQGWVGRGPVFACFHRRLIG